MFYDLNIQWSAHDQQLAQTLAFAHELGYNVVALNHTIQGKLPAEVTCPIPNPLPQKDLPSGLTVLRRMTLVLTDSHQNARLAALAKECDILAVRPIDEHTLQVACGSLDCDIISMDLTQRWPFHFKHKHKTLSQAIKAGKRLEICYSQAVLGDTPARRNLISNATQLIRATRGKGLLLSSDVKDGPIGCRGPWDVINLTTVWGLAQDRAHEAVTKEARNAVVLAQLKRTGWKGAVDVVHGGAKPIQQDKQQQDQSQDQKKSRQKQKQKQSGSSQKRKADSLTDGGDGKTIAQRGGNPTKHVKQ